MVLLVGTTTINNASNTGAITGGIIGGVFGTVKINFVYNYQDIEMIGVIRGGTVAITDSYNLYTTLEDGVTTLTVEKFAQQGSFDGWDFNTIWTMGSEYPVLK